ncbi:unnamed protein product [Ambrosiozyma monospora]|uniref:Unnamed protein product n=1 Tax=Ambrosiozyma monospora TaxID=43982 RepID=A0ACB5TCJ5_AMBMO|nr:unnamed protein product [Ambrosiozyma monospora]
MGFLLFVVLGENVQTNLSYLNNIFCKKFSSVNDTVKEKFMTMNHDGAYLKAVDSKHFLQNFYLVYLFRFGDIVIDEPMFSKGGDYYIKRQNSGSTRRFGSNRPGLSSSERREVYLMITECSFILQLIILMEYPRDELNFLEEWITEFSKKLKEFQFKPRFRNTILVMLTFPFHMLLHIKFFMSKFGPLRMYWSFPMERVCHTVTVLSKAPSTRVQLIGLTTMLKSTFEAAIISGESTVDDVSQEPELKERTKKFDPYDMILKKCYDKDLRNEVWEVARNASRVAGKGPELSPKAQIRPYQLHKDKELIKPYGLHKVSHLTLTGGDFSSNTEVCYFMKDEERVYALVDKLYHYTSLPRGK